MAEFPLRLEARKRVLPVLQGDAARDARCELHLAERHDRERPLPGVPAHGHAHGLVGNLHPSPAPAAPDRQVVVGNVVQVDAERMSPHADDGHPAALLHHLQRLADRLVSARAVDDEVRAGAAGQLAHARNRVLLAEAGVVGAQLARLLQTDRVRAQTGDEDRPRAVEVDHLQHRQADGPRTGDDDEIPGEDAAAVHEGVAHAGDLLDESALLE